MGNGWEDNRSFIEESRVNNEGSFTGQYFLNDNQFSFSITRQSKGEYLMRGRCSLISPHDGHILQVQGKERRKRIKKLENNGIEYDGISRLEALNASSAVYSRTDNLEEIKAIIKRTALKLYGENILAIEDEIKRTAPAQGIHSAQAVRIYSEKFLSHSKASAPTIKANRNSLVCIGAFFDRCPMSEITQKEIRKFADDMGVSSDKKLKLARRFWEYCRDVGLYAGVNPFDLFLERNSTKKGKTSEALQHNALKELPFEVEAALNKRIEEHLSDGRYIGLVLVKGAGLAAKEACSKKWRDVIYNEEDYRYVRIKIPRYDLAGSTHEFTHPLFPFEGEMLHRRYDMLSDKYTQDELLDMPVATALRKDKTPLTSKELTAFCRTELNHAGIKYAVLAIRNDEPGGIGIQLMHRNYAYKISEECGLKDDKASVIFLKAQSLRSDVTADNYHAFYSPEGQLRLYRVMCRDRRFESLKAHDECLKRISTPGGKEEITVDSPDPQRISGAKLSIHLKAGEHIRVSSPCGVHGTVSARRVD